ncbi:uncharacterized protein LOC118437851 [Folsomia candida]|uniref:non-specific serine/threonine protein kinase n=1 Tax=Folsomia candida TaxID=158441 RepID=A0A226DML5_FOLCA|nr:uncharacterized protein LOC118437851 [Folsomia candida]OXA45907.1 Serine/threonine-protein kinase pdik1l-A [Folsomia candida]
MADSPIYTSLLGQGAFGIVLKSILSCEAESAVKFIFPNDNDERVKLLREYTVTKGLEKHANIVQIIDMEEERLYRQDIEEIFHNLPKTEQIKTLKSTITKKTKGYSIQSIRIKMELCGQTLRKWLNESLNGNDLHIQIRQNTMVQNLITGLKYLHDNKIIHRDLKPENIMFSKGRYQLPVKIGDFGHSRKIHSEESNTGGLLTTGVGTRSYMAPEVRHGNYSYAADIYSLGLIIWEVVQLLGDKRNIDFDKLVYDKKEELVEDHVIMIGIRNIIISMSRRTVEERIGLEEIDFSPWNDNLSKIIEDQGCKFLWDCILNSSKEFVVRTNTQLKLALDNAVHGCVIRLNEAVYTGRFSLLEDKISIIGQGSRSLLKFGDAMSLNIYGDEISISNIKISVAKYKAKYCLRLDGSRNVIKDVEFSNGEAEYMLMVAGDDNKLETLAISESYGGIYVTGQNNTITKILMDNVRSIGIFIGYGSSDTKISDITLSNVIQGIIVNGSKAHISKVKLTKASLDTSSLWNKPQRYIGLVVYGSDFKVEDINCSDYSRITNDWGMIINGGSGEITDCFGGSIRIAGSNVKLINVSCGELLEIDNDAKDVTLVSCCGQKLMSIIKPVMMNNQFELIVIPLRI